MVIDLAQVPDHAPGPDNDPTALIPKSFRQVSLAGMAGQEGLAKRQCDRQAGLKRPRGLKCNSAQRSSPLSGGETVTPRWLFPPKRKPPFFWPSHGAREPQVPSLECEDRHTGGLHAAQITKFTVTDIASCTACPNLLGRCYVAPLGSLVPML